MGREGKGRNGLPDPNPFPHFKQISP